MKDLGKGFRRSESGAFARVELRKNVIEIEKRKVKSFLPHFRHGVDDFDVIFQTLVVVFDPRRILLKIIRHQDARREIAFGRNPQNDQINIVLFQILFIRFDAIDVSFRVIAAFNAGFAASCEE